MFGSLTFLAKFQSPYITYIRVESENRIKNTKVDHMLQNKYSDLRIWRTTRRWMTWIYFVKTNKISFYEVTASVILPFFVTIEHIDHVFVINISSQTYIMFFLSYFMQRMVHLLAIIQYSSYFPGSFSLKSF